jgi:hypothetical protein
VQIFLPGVLVLLVQPATVMVCPSSYSRIFFLATQVSSARELNICYPTDCIRSAVGIGLQHSIGFNISRVFDVENVGMCLENVPSEGLLDSEGEWYSQWDHNTYGMSGASEDALGKPSDPEQTEGTHEAPFKAKAWPRKC